MIITLGLAVFLPTNKKQSAFKGVLGTRERTEYLKFSPTDFIIMPDNYCRRIHSDQIHRIEFKEFYFIHGRPEFVRQRYINFIDIININCIS